MNSSTDNGNDLRLSGWLKAEMKRRNLSNRELAEQAGIAHSSVGRALDPEEPVSYTVCYKLAMALNINPATMLEMAGLLPRTHPKSAIERDLVFLFSRLTDEQKDQVLQYIQFLAK